MNQSYNKVNNNFKMIPCFRFAALKAIVLIIFSTGIASTYAVPNSSTVPESKATLGDKQTLLSLKGGATIQGQILNVSSDAVTLSTGSGELLIPLKNLEDTSRLRLESKIVEEKKEATVIANKQKTKLVSKILEEEEIRAQESEGDSPRVKLGRKEYVFRKYTYRGSDIDYIFTPVGQNQVYDSEETLRAIFHKSIQNPPQAMQIAQEIKNNLGEGIAMLPPTTGGPALGGNVEFAGAVEGNNGNPSRIIFGRTFRYNNHYATLIYTRFARDKTFDETKAWLGRNFERLQIILRGVTNLPQEELMNATSEGRSNKPPTKDSSSNEETTNKSQNKENNDQLNSLESISEGLEPKEPTDKNKEELPLKPKEGSEEEIPKD